MKDKRKRTENAEHGERDVNGAVPRPGPDTEAYPGERRPEDDRPGSQTGTIGGGGRDARNPSPTRATGSDDDPEEV